MLTRVGTIVLLSVVLVEESQGQSSTNKRGCWEENIIPYYIGKGFRQDQLEELYNAIAVFHKYTCLRWADYSSESGDDSPNHLVQFVKVKEGNCRVALNQKINGKVISFVQLLDKCFTQYFLMHEMMHVLGFEHEHQRSDRNCYVYVASGAESFRYYKIHAHEPWLERYPYDIYSVLHYRRNYMMQSRKEGRGYGTDFLGNAYGQLTHLDLSKVLYKFCGGPHYCDVNPEDCRRADEWRRYQGCASR